MSDLLQKMRQRRSVRGFKPDMVPRELIDNQRRRTYPKA